MAAVFPYLPGISWPVARSEGRFDTTTLEAMSGKQIQKEVKRGGMAALRKLARE